MSNSRSFHRVPRGGVDPICNATDALAVLALGTPYGDDTIAILLDQQRCGNAIIVVTGTVHADALFSIIETAVDAMLDVDEIDGLILATSRPGGGVEPDDVHRWLEASNQCDAGGLELVEWIILGETIGFPRELFGEPPRW